MLVPNVNSSLGFQYNNETSCARRATQLSFNAGKMYSIVGDSGMPLSCFVDICYPIYHIHWNLLNRSRRATVGTNKGMRSIQHANLMIQAILLSELEKKVVSCLLLWNAYKCLQVCRIIGKQAILLNELSWVDSEYWIFKWKLEKKKRCYHSFSSSQTTNIKNNSMKKHGTISNLVQRTFFYCLISI